MSGRLVVRTGNGSRIRQHVPASHTPAEDVGRIGERARTRHLIFHHLMPADDPAITAADWRMAVAGRFRYGRLTVGHDGMEVVLNDPPKPGRGHAE